MTLLHHRTDTTKLMVASIWSTMAHGPTSNTTPPVDQRTQFVDRMQRVPFTQTVAGAIAVAVIAGLIVLGIQKAVFEPATVNGPTSRAATPAASEASQKSCPTTWGRNWTTGDCIENAPPARDPARPRPNYDLITCASTDTACHTSGKARPCIGGLSRRTYSVRNVKDAREVHFYCD